MDPGRQRPAQPSRMQLRTEAMVHEKFPEICHGARALDTIKCNLVNSSSSFWEEISSPENLLRYIPAVSWLRSYCCSEWKQYLMKDISAGLVIGIMLIPQVMALVIVLKPFEKC